jgi:hypothetical protein
MSQTTRTVLRISLRTVEISGVQVDEEDGRVLHHDLHGSDEGRSQVLLRREIALVDLALRLKPQVAGQFAQAACSPEQNV